MKHTQYEIAEHIAGDMVHELYYSQRDLLYPNELRLSDVDYAFARKHIGDDWISLASFMNDLRHAVEVELEARAHDEMFGT